MFSGREGTVTKVIVEETFTKNNTHSHKKKVCAAFIVVPPLRSLACDVFNVAFLPYLYIACYVKAKEKKAEHPPSPAFRNNIHIRYSYSLEGVASIRNPLLKCSLCHIS